MEAAMNRFVHWIVFCVCFVLAQLYECKASYKSPYTVEEAINKIFRVTIDNKMSQTASIAIVNVLRELLPEGHLLPKYLPALKQLCLSQKDVQEIEACGNDCMLYTCKCDPDRRARVDCKLHDMDPHVCDSMLTACTVCKSERSKENCKIFRYLGVGNALRYMMKNDELGPLLRLPGKDQTQCQQTVNGDNLVTNIWQSAAWEERTRDCEEKEANGTEPEERWVFLSFSTDGTNPFKGGSSAYTIWPLLCEVKTAMKSLCHPFVLCSILVCSLSCVVALTISVCLFFVVCLLC